MANQPFGRWAVAISVVFCVAATPAFAGDPFVERARRQVQDGTPPAGPTPPAGKKATAPPAARTDEQIQRDMAKFVQVRTSIAKALAQAEQLINEGKHADAYVILEECRKRWGKLIDPDTQALFARIALCEADPERAMKYVVVVPHVADNRDHYRSELFNCYYVLGQAYLQSAGLDEGRADASVPSPAPEEDRPSRALPSTARPRMGSLDNPVPTFFGMTFDPATVRANLDDDARKNADAALVLFDWLASHNEYLAGVLSAEGCAKALVLLGRYQDALGAYEFALHNLRILARGESTQMPAHLRKILGRLTAGLNAARRLHDIEQYSYEYVLFREAEILRREKKEYAQAIAKYNEVVQVAGKTMAELAKQEAGVRGQGSASGSGSGTFFGVPTNSGGDGAAVVSSPSQGEDRPSRAATRPGEGSPGRLTPSTPQQPQESPFAAAAKFYRCLCLIELGSPSEGTPGSGQEDKAKLAEAARGLKLFIDTDPGTKRILDATKSTDPVKLTGPAEDDDAHAEAVRGQMSEISPDPNPQTPNPATLPGPGLYRGEALLELGRLALEHDLDLKRADTYFRGLDAWIAAVRKEEQAWDFATLLPGIKAAAKKRTDGPKNEKFTDFWGNVEKTKIEPGQLVNRKTAPWYLNDLEENAAKYRGFVCFVRGERENAMTQWIRIASLDPQTRGDNAMAPDDLMRLHFAARRGHMLALPEEAALYSGKQKTALLLADFQFAIASFDAARDQYEALLAGRFGPLAPPQQDFLQFAIGLCHLRTQNTAEAIKRWRAVIDRTDGTMTEFRAAYAIAHLSRYSRDKDLRAYGTKLLKSLADSKANNHFTRTATIVLAMECAREGKRDEAIRLLKRIDQKDKAAHELASQLIANGGEVKLPPLPPRNPNNKKGGARREWQPFAGADIPPPAPAATDPSGNDPRKPGFFGVDTQ